MLFKDLIMLLNILENNWTEREILNLEIKLKKLIFRISKYPKIYPATSKVTSLRKALIDNNNYLIYRINTNTNTIEILYFKSTKQKPL